VEQSVEQLQLQSYRTLVTGEQLYEVVQLQLVWMYAMVSQLTQFTAVQLLQLTHWKVQLFAAAQLVTVQFPALVFW
jgi:hypothetical protein